MVEERRLGGELPLYFIYYFLFFSFMEEKRTEEQEKNGEKVKRLLSTEKMMKVCG